MRLRCYDRPHDVKPYRVARPLPMEAPGNFTGSRDLNDDLLALVGSGDLCSKRWIWQQYDYTVRTNTLLRGRAGDAAIVRIKETDTSVAMSLDGKVRGIARLIRGKAPNCWWRSAAGICRPLARHRWRLRTI